MTAVHHSSGSTLVVFLPFIINTFGYQDEALYRLIIVSIVAAAIIVIMIWSRNVVGGSGEARQGNGV